MDTGVHGLMSGQRSLEKMNENHESIRLYMTLVEDPLRLGHKNYIRTARLESRKLSLLLSNGCVTWCLLPKGEADLEEVIDSIRKVDVVQELKVGPDELEVSAGKAAKKLADDVDTEVIRNLIEEAEAITNKKQSVPKKNKERKSNGIFTGIKQWMRT